MFFGGLSAAFRHYSTGSVKVFHKDQFLVLSYSYSTLYSSQFSYLLSYLIWFVSRSSSICWWHSIVHLLPGTWILRQYKQHLQNTINLASRWMSANLLWLNLKLSFFLLVYLLNYLKSLLLLFLCLLMSLLLNLLVILAIFFILLSRCLIISPKFLNLASYLFAIF